MHVAATFVFVASVGLIGSVQQPPSRPSPAIDEDAHPASHVLVVGHRGAPAHLPENTLAGFAFALENGADAVELDVRVAKDGALVVIHDATVPARCTVNTDANREAARRVRDLTVSELRAFDCGAADPAFPQQRPAPGARIPTLDEVLALGATHTDARFFIELKADDAPAPDVVAAKVARAVMDRGLRTRAVIESFDEAQVRAVGHLAPGLARGLLVDDAPDAVERAARVGAAVLSCPSRTTNAALVAAAHARDVAVVPYTENSEDGWRRLASAGVDGIVTDDAPALARLRAGS